MKPQKYSEKKIACITVKFLNFWKTENFALIYLKFKQKSTNLRVVRKKDANEIANSEDPDQTAPL